MRIRTLFLSALIAVSLPGLLGTLWIAARAWASLRRTDPRRWCSPGHWGRIWTRRC